MDNAKAFVDFLLSDEGQKLVCDAYLLPGRRDITTDKRPNVKEIPQLKHDWDEMMKIAGDYAARLVALCK